MSKHDGVSDGRYKLIHFYGPEGSYDELYDLKNDPHELRNVIDAPDCRKARARLTKTLDRFRKRLKVNEF